MKCENCGKEKPASSFNAESFSPTTCFPCRVSGISFTNPIKSGQGSDQWRHSTIREFQRNQVAEAASNGLEAVPKWSVPSTGTVPSKVQKLKDHLNG